MAHGRPQQNTPSIITTRLAAEMWDARPPASMSFLTQRGGCYWRSVRRLNTCSSRRVVASSRRGQDSVFVFARAHAGVGENPVVGDPFESLLVDLLGVGLEYEALSRTPPACVHPGVITHRKFVPVVVRVEFGSQIDVALRAPQCAEELAYVFRIGIARQRSCDHERRVDDFAETKLLCEIIRTREQCRRLRFAFEQLIKAVEQHAVSKSEID